MGARAPIFLMKQNSIILERYIKIALNNFKNVIAHKHHYQFRCNVCGDGSKRNNMRGHIKYSEKENFFYYICYNANCEAEWGGSAWPADKWLKHTSPDLHRQYLREILLPKDQEEIEKKREEIKVKEVKKEKEKHGKMIPLSVHNNSLMMRTALHYCSKRLIPRKTWETWYLALDGKYKDRLIIPFYDKKGQIYYYQARTLSNQEPKYLNRVKGKENAIYNWYWIDKKEPVYIFEGIIDSLFVKNSIAIIGLNVDSVREKINTIKKRRWILDNDESGKARSEKLLRENEYVFMWKEFLKDNNLPQDTKDINEAVILSDKTGITGVYIEQYFTNSYYNIIKV